jgi:hypothetical protein
MIDRQRLTWELRKMRELINNDPQVRARFDRNGDGTIDGDEWEQVRQLVVQRIEREAAETAEAERLAQEAGEPQARTEEVIGFVAQEIYDTDLQAQAAEPAARPTSGSATSLAEASELILEQEGGLGQIFEGMCRRSYSVLTRDGSSLASVQQVENEMLQNMTHTDPFSMPDLSFRVTTSGGDLYTFTRSQGFRSDCVEVQDPAGRPVGFVTWTPALLKREYQVVSALDRGSLTVRSQLLRPFTLQILAEDGRNVGSIVRGWSGLGGFLSGGNRMRIQTEPGCVTPGQRWGLLAAALLADLASESRKQNKKGFSSFLGS